MLSFSFIFLLVHVFNYPRNAVSEIETTTNNEARARARSIGFGQGWI